MNEFIEILEKAKNACAEIDCADCPLSVGIYQEGLNYVYYSCDIRKKPRDWDLKKKRMKQDKNYRKNLEKQAKKEAEAAEKKTKKRGRKKKNESTVHTDDK